jgi:hypothetical protein
MLGSSTVQGMWDSSTVQEMWDRSTVRSNNGKKPEKMEGNRFSFIDYSNNVIICGSDFKIKKK